MLWIAVQIALFFLVVSLDGVTVVTKHPKQRCYRNQSVLLYTVVGQSSESYFKMVSLMIASCVNNTRTPVDVLLLAHESWSKPLKDVGFPHRVVLVDQDTFLDGLDFRNMRGSAAALKLRIFKLYPNVYKYDLVVFLDADIVVTQDVPSFIGDIDRYLCSWHRNFVSPRSPHHSLGHTLECKFYETHLRSTCLCLCELPLN